MGKSIIQDLPDFIKESERQFKKNIPIDCSEFNDEAIIDVFRCNKNAYHKEGKTIDEEFYGGITNDIPSNLRRHNIETYIVCVKVDSFETAKRIEGLLYSKLGFFIGENEEESAGRGGASDSNIVYMAKRDEPGFKD